MKNFGGGMWTKVKNFFVGEASIFKKVGRLVDGAMDWIKGAFGEGNLFKRIKRNLLFLSHLLLFL